MLLANAIKKTPYMQKSQARVDMKYHNSVECFHLLNLTSDYKQVI